MMMPTDTTLIILEGEAPMKSSKLNDISSKPYCGLMLYLVNLVVGYSVNIILVL